MIIVSLKGGFGNQMFQYAFGRHLACKYNVDLLLDLHFYEDTGHDSEYTYRKYELDKLNISARIATEADIQMIRNNLKWHHSFKPFYQRHIVKEKGYTFNDKYLRVPDNSLINGYWQSEKYFRDIESIIKKELTFKEGFNEEYSRQIETEIKNSTSVGIHFRRGDYVNDSKINQYHGVCSMQYYHKAIDHISKHIDNPLFFVFSDDIEWVKEHFQTPFQTVFVERGKEETHRDFRLMSMCKHNIIANSSYSWWAAWLNNHDNKIVLAPDRWFANDKQQSQTRDLIPERWIQI